MPTEAEIEAAARAAVEWCKTNLDACDVSPICGTTISTDDEIDLSGLAIAALTAAEEVRGQVSEDDAALIALWERLTDDISDNALATMPAGELRRLLALALARRGAVQAVLDEAAIRADERERCAKIAEDMRTRLAGVLVGPALYVGPNAPAAIADAIRADAQKPGDKP